MPKHFDDYGDARQRTWCVHCGTALSLVKTNREHVPTKSLLVDPLPNDYPNLPVCMTCNEKHSLDEEYFVAFMSCVLSGSTSPSDQKIPAASRVLERNSGLRIRIENSKSKSSPIFNPELERLKRVIVKNARCHVLYEASEPHWGEPDEVFLSPIELMSDEMWKNFLVSNHVQPWPEVGSRWMQRIVGENAFDHNGFYNFQNGTYRFRIELEGGIGVSSVIWNYLATRVIWR